MPVIRDLTIDSERYAVMIEDYLTDKTIELVQGFYADVASQFGYEVPGYYDIENVGYNTGDLPEARDALIKYIETCGFKVNPDGNDF